MMILTSNIRKFLPLKRQALWPCKIQVKLQPNKIQHGRQKNKDIFSGAVNASLSGRLFTI